MLLCLAEALVPKLADALAEMSREAGREFQVSVICQNTLVICKWN